MRRIVMLLALAGAGGCEGVLGPDVPVSAYVRVTGVDHADMLRPDSVMWYYEPETARYDGQHKAICVNRACTVWGVPPEATGLVYVVATRVRPYHGDPHCQRSGYDAGVLMASRDDPPTISLELDMETVTCS
jgi:hypothetical protein